MTAEPPKAPPPDAAAFPAVSATRARGRAAAALALLLLLLLFPFVGRAVVSSDAAEVVSDTLGLFVTGRLSAPSMPQAYPHPAVPPPPPFHSHYGFWPSAFLVPFVALPWALRNQLGAAGLDAAVALTWTAGAGLTAWAFLRLARALRPGASPLWASAFLCGTFLWPYAADSFFETFAAFGLALAAREVLVPRPDVPMRGALLAAAGFTLAAALKPVLWTTAPVLVLAAAVGARRRQGGQRPVASLLVLLAAGLALAVVPNLVEYGSGGNLGYGGEVYHFDTSLPAGLFGLFLSPGRGVFLYAPLTLAALLAFRRLSPEARLVCFGMPLLLACVAGRWHGWNGGSAWGPRYLLPILPLLAAPAVLLPRRVTLPATLVGVAVSLLGVLVAPGAWITWVETLKPPPGAAWSTSGADVVSDVPAVSPLYGHVWLLARSAGAELPRPWISAGAVEQAPPPTAAGYLSPWILRRGLGLPPVPPMLPSVLYRIGVAGALRARPDLAVPFLEEALRLEPRHAGARSLLERLRKEPSNPR